MDPERLRFWEVLGTLKWGVICQVQAARHTREHPSLEHALIGRRTTETELDLLVLLEEVDRVGVVSRARARRRRRTSSRPSPTCWRARSSRPCRGASPSRPVSPRGRCASSSASWRSSPAADRLTGPDGAEVTRAALATSIRQGHLDAADPALRELLARDVLDRIGIDSPDYPTVREARQIWPGLG